MESVKSFAQRRTSWLVLAGYTLFTLFFTWPLITKLGSAIYGGPGDLTGGIATLREYTEGVFPFAPGRFDDFGAPEGLIVAWPLNIATFTSTLPMYMLSLVFGPYFALNMLVLTGHIVTAQATYLFARKLTGNTGAAIIAGFAFAFFPFFVIKSRGHDYFIHGWVFVLVLWRMWELAENRTRRNGLLAGGAIVVCVAWNPYFLLIGGVLAATLVVAELIRSWRDRELRSSIVALAWAAVPVGAYMFVVAVTTAVADVPGTREHPIEALTIYAARAHEYVVPHLDHTFFGGLTEEWLNARLHGSNYAEATLYLGLSVLLLAVAGVFAAFRGKIKVPRTRTSVVVLIAVGLVAFVSSAPPTVTLPLIGLDVHTPSYFIYKIVPAWRVYSRFVIVVMLAATLLAAYGIAWLSNRRSRFASVAVLVAIGALVMADLWQEDGSTSVTTVGYDPIYETLKEQPYGIVAEYPMEPYGYGDYSAEFYQDRHGMPILNGFGENTPEEWRAMTLARLDDPAVASRLAALGVKYVVDTHVPINLGVQKPGRPGKRFVKLEETPYATLYRVDAEPAALVWIGGPGFTPPNGTTQWIEGEDATLHMFMGCGDCNGKLSFSARSMAKPRRLLVSEGGKKLATFDVPWIDNGAKRFSLPVSVRDGRLNLDLHADPGAASVAGVTGGADTRSLSIQIDDLRFTPDRQTSG